MANCLNLSGQLWANDQQDKFLSTNITENFAEQNLLRILRIRSVAAAVAKTSK